MYDFFRESKFSRKNCSSQRMSHKLSRIRIMGLPTFVRNNLYILPDIMKYRCCDDCIVVKFNAMSLTVLFPNWVQNITCNNNLCEIIDFLCKNYNDSP